MDDLIQLNPCKWGVAIEYARFKNSTKYGTYDKAEYITELLRNKFKIQLDLTDEQVDYITFINGTYNYADAITSERFAGIEQIVDWTPEDIDALNMAQVYGLLMGYTMPTRKLANSRMIYVPMSHIKNLSGFVPTD